MSEPGAWSDEARETLYSIYRFWAANSRPPGAADLHEMTGMDVNHLRQAFVELQAGSALVYPQDRLRLTIFKALPYSAVPTAVSSWIEGAFHSYVGCPAEAMTISVLPLYQGVTLTMRSHCGCCFAPIELSLREGEIIATSSEDIRVAIVTSPWEFAQGPIDQACEAFFFVLNEDHAHQLEDQLGRKGAIATLGQIQKLGSRVAHQRMTDPNWGPIRILPEGFIRLLEKNGVDVSVWR